MMDDDECQRQLCMNPLQTHHKRQCKTNLDPFHAYERSIEDLLTYAKVIHITLVNA